MPGPQLWRICDLVDASGRHRRQHGLHHGTPIIGKPDVAPTRISVVGFTANQTLVFQPRDPAQYRRRWNAGIKAHAGNLEFGFAALCNIEIEQNIPARFTEQTFAACCCVPCSTKLVKRSRQSQAILLRVDEGVQLILPQHFDPIVCQTPQSDCKLAWTPLPRQISKTTIRTPTPINFPTGRWLTQSVADCLPKCRHPSALDHSRSLAQ